MIRIVHLSDIHFGPRFSFDTWKAVAHAVVEVEPDLIIVSGDLVDHPWPAHLLAAKCELRELQARAHAESQRRSGQAARPAELVVIPGNHDLFEWGLSVSQGRIDWYERVFEQNTDNAEAELQAELGSAVGFNKACRDRKAILPGRWLGLRELLFGPPMPDFTRHLAAVQPQPLCIKRFESLPVLLALLDSNPRENGVDLATGLVSDGQLVGLEAELKAAASHPYLARIAVVHHHVLPIAYAGGRGARLEPTMVLRNAGTLLRILGEYRFDLILHGHWHTPQFARHDDKGEGYPMGVAAAGSAAMTTDDPTGNCFNLVTVADNGRIEVRAVYYGTAQAPKPYGTASDHVRVYEEEIAAVKRRAFTRARERHGIACDLREQICTISENGDLVVEHRVEGLRLYGGREPHPRRPLGVAIPEYGRFVEKTLQPDDESKKAGIRIVPNPPAPGAIEKRKRYWIMLPGRGLFRNSRPAAYGLSHACANCMPMTRWEAQQRLNHGARVGAPAADPWDEEWVGLWVAHPMGRAVLRVVFPEELAETQPFVRCSKIRGYPAYPIDDNLGDAIFPADFNDLEGDQDFQEEASRGLVYDASKRTWTLGVDRPMVGYQYELRWQLPGKAPDGPIEGRTQAYRDLLMKLATSSANPETPVRRAAMEAFHDLVQTMEKELSGGEHDEKWIAALFVYDSDELALRPALNHSNWSSQAMTPAFKVPLGGGVAGAAFQQRRIIPWGKSRAEASLIEPIPYPARDGEEWPVFVNMLAVPVYHPKMWDKPRPPHWATIGVVTFGTTSYASPIAALEPDAPDAGNRLLKIHVLAQTQVVEILDSFYRSAPHATG